MGRYNYLQLMSASSVPYSGIVLAVERPDGLAMLRAQGSFKASPPTSVGDHTTSRGVNVVELADRITPAGIDSISDHVGFDILQYSAEAARIKSRVDSLPETRLSSSRFLAGYLDSRKLLSHLTGATIAIPVNEISKIVAVLKRDNVNVVSEGEGATIKLDGFTLHLIPPYRGAGVKQLQFALTHAAAANPTYRFGPKSQLRFGPGLIAVWDFEIK